MTYNKLNIPKVYHLTQKTEYDAAIPLLDIDPDKTTIQKDTCTPIFIAALFRIAKTWKSPTCPSRHEWIQKRWNTTQPFEAT